MTIERVAMPLSNETFQQAVRCRKTLLDTLPQLDERWLIAFNTGEFAAANAYATAFTMIRDALEMDP